MSRACVVSLVVANAALLVGCGGGGDDLPRQAVSGLVVFDGTPLPSGTIRFEPVDPNGPTSVGSSIDAGKYSVSRAVGLVPGKYRVSITGSSTESESTGVDDTGMPGMPPPPPKEQLPSKFNSKTTLEAEVQEGATNEFNFDLKSS